MLATIADDWKETHFSEKTGRWSEWGRLYGRTSEETWLALKALPDNATEKEVRALVSPGWIENKCDECGNDVGEAVQFLYEYRFCADCLRAALALIEAAANA